jgi:hypothetical protein
MPRFDPIMFLLIPSVVCVAPGWSTEFLTQAEAQRALFPETQLVWRAMKDGRPLGWFIIDEVTAAGSRPAPPSGARGRR